MHSFAHMPPKVGRFDRPQARKMSCRRCKLVSQKERFELSDDRPTSAIARRFRGYLPVVIDLETSGFDPTRNALLELGASIIHMNDDGTVRPGELIFHHVKPFEGAEHDPDALAFTGIDPNHPFRMAVDESEALSDFFRKVRASVRSSGCQRAIVTAHNASFDHAFLREAAERAGLKRNPFHPFSSLDTASIAAIAYGQTVLSRACEAAWHRF